MIPSLPDHRLILDTLPVSVVRLNRLLRVTYANARICRILGRAEADVLGRSCLELGMTADHWGPWDETVRRTFDTGEPGEFEYLGQVAGHERFVEYRVTPEPGPDGRPASVLVTAVTNDEVPRLRAALKDREGRFAAFMDHGPMIAWMRDEAGRYVYLNNIYLRHFGLAAADILGKPIEERWPADVARAMLENDRRVFAGGGPVQVYEQAPDPDGTTHTWLNVKFPFTDAAGEQCVGGVGVDVTDRVRAEQARQDLERQLFQAQKLESLGVLAGGVAHDFNNLLTIVLANAGMALRNLRPDAPAAEHVRHVEEASTRAADLCEQLLSYAGHGRVLARPLDLGGLVRDTARMIAPVVPAGTTVDVACPPGLPQARGDSTQIRQVVMNLLTNAVEAVGPGGGRVAVTLGEVLADRDDLDGLSLPDAVPPGRYVWLAVADTGAGMDDRTRGRIFDPFFTTKPQGRGLGLAAVQGIIRGHRGGIAVESRLGHGTTFRVLLPAAEVPSCGRFGRGRTVVLVDPDPGNCAATRATFERAGFVVLATAGPDALDVVGRLPGQVATVVLDATGWPGGPADAVRAVRAARPDLPVLLASDRSPADLTAELPRGSVAGFVGKPVRPPDLLAAVFDAVGP
ncbi:MAG: PAS domain-containing protein [Fimbriiglobus sp.]